MFWIQAHTTVVSMCMECHTSHVYRILAFLFSFDICFCSFADANMKLGLGSGILIGVPIPAEHAASGALIESAIQRALKEARFEWFTPYFPFILVPFLYLCHTDALLGIRDAVIIMLQEILQLPSCLQE